MPAANVIGSSQRRGIIVAKRHPESLSTVETEAIVQIRARRALPGDHLGTFWPNDPAHIIHKLILGSHGHVKLRFGPLAAELGVEMRTLERLFVKKYGKTMSQCKLEERVALSKSLLRVTPLIKISVIANLLGYDEVRDFNRFFSEHVRETPSIWGKNARNRAQRRTPTTPCPQD